MSRSGYTDSGDEWALIRWRGAVASAIRGNRGQAFFRELRDVLKAMPEKRLIAEDLITKDGEVCAIGAVGRARGIDMAKIDQDEPADVAAAFGIAPALAAEIAYENDQDFWTIKNETPEARYERILGWAEMNCLEWAET